VIIQPVKLHGEILKAYLSSILDNVTISTGNRIQGMETTPSTMVVKATFNDGIERFAVTTADAVMFLWNFGQICPILHDQTLYLWCSGGRNDLIDMPTVHIALQFSSSPDLLKAFNSRPNYS